LTIEEIKKIVSEEFKLEESHTFFKVDAFEEPTQAMRRVKLPLPKYNISSGDLLILKSDKQLIAGDKLKLNLHLT
jgi:hypothetical protein